MKIFKMKINNNYVKFSLSTLIAFLFFLISTSPSLATCPGTTNISLITIVGGDTCTVPAANTYVIDVATGENSTAGTALATNGGSLTINNTGTLRLGAATFGGGTLTVQAGGTLNAGLAFWVSDADADNWPSSYTVATATAPATRRLGLMSSTSTLDCLDSALSYTNTCYAYSQSAYYAYGQGGYYGYGQGSYYFYSQGGYYGYGQSYYNSCFLAGTKVLLANGETKEIQNILPGDVVASYNLNTGKRGWEVVVKLLIHEGVEGGYLVINHDLKITENHRVWSPNKSAWVRMNTLVIGDSLLNSEGVSVKIDSIEKVTGVNTVYNLSLPGPTHTYFANGYLVHNEKVGFVSK